MKSFSENLMELRTKRRMTQGELAELLGVSRQSVSKWENGTEKTVPIARDIWITRDPGNDEYSVSFSVSQQIN